MVPERLIGTGPDIIRHFSRPRAVSIQKLLQPGEGEAGTFSQPFEKGTPGLV
jgi:hypothetical protein